MIKLQIIRINDDLVEKADLKVGNNIISRGVVAGRDDGRVIKNAVTINLSPTGKMTITPYQVSPCYIKSAGSSRWQLLKLGVTAQIKAGDVCALLPDKCWFKIVSVPDVMEESNVSKRKSEEPLSKEPSDKKLRVENSLDAMSHGDSLNDHSNPESEVALERQSNECSSTSSANINCPSTAEGDTATLEDRGSLGKQQTLATANDNNVVNKDVEASETIGRNINNESNDKNSLTVEQGNDASASRLQAPTTTHTDSPRNKCAYGRKCYRKSVRHKEKYSHPGDEDYDTLDSRPECYYGVKCYRKNEQHRKNFKHTTLHPRRSKASTQPMTSYAFLDDDSAEESVDESDFDPTWVSTSSEEEWDDDIESDLDDEESEVDLNPKKCRP